jgi:hypothetical protein
MLSFFGWLSSRLFANYRVGLLLFAGVPSAAAFSLNGYSWAAGSQIQMHLQLTRPPVVLQDDSPSWNASAADALSIWNQYLDTVSFVEAAATGASGGDGANSVFFASTIYGETFPSGVLAVTLNESSSGSSVFTETDVIFNNSIKWNSYRGPMQGSGPSGTYDLHRVALHEFGHVLGLDHPDQHGQTVTAIMNSIISDLGHLADDDLAGVRSLYGVRITSSLASLTILAGDPFSYQISANNAPATYEANGLPPGLSLDPNSGVINGTPTVAGNFMVSIIAHGTPRDATGTLSITVLGSRITSNLHPPSVHVGNSFAYQITATNNPFAFDAVGLPAGLSLNRTSGLISGTPTATGTFSVTLTAHASPGDGSATVIIVVIPFDITSNQYPAASLGGDFKYQVTANNNPTSYGAVGLPPGLELDRMTGLITGTLSLSGSYQFTIIAHGPKGDAIGMLHITVATPPPLQPRVTGALKTFDFSAQRLAFDPIRSRLYASDQSAGMIVVIDTVSLSAVAAVKLPHQPYGLAISGDNTKLWAACSDPLNSYDGWVCSINLNTLEVLPSIHVSSPISYVAQGPANRLYVSGTGTFVVDQNTGASAGTIYPADGFLIAKQNLLFVASTASPATVWAFDTSQTPAQLREETDWNTRGQSGGRDLKISHNGKYLCFADGQGNGRVFGMTSTALMSTADVRLVLGNFINNSSNVANAVGPMAFSNDDAVFYQAAALDDNDGGGMSRLGIFDVASYSQTGFIDLGHISTQMAPTVNDMVVDGSGACIFVSTSASGYTGQMRVYSTGRGVPPPGAAAPARSVLNVSTRLHIDAGENVGIGGFIIKGNMAKKVMIRAIGPSLSTVGVAGALADPILEVHDGSGQPIAQNDSWNSHRLDALLSGLAPTDEHESALILTLPPGAYTAVVRGANADAGVALVEVYDLTADSDSKLANIATRGQVGTDANVMIGGFIIGGNQTTNVAVRAIGPSLATFGVGGALTDPILEVYDRQGVLLAQDDDWRMYQEQALIDSGLAPTDNRESAMLLSLQPGAYTAIVRGKNDSTGVGLVEVYNLDAN